MGKDGSKWKHGYIPENAAATALKAHRKPGAGKSTTAKKTTSRPKTPPKIINPGGRNMQDLSVPKSIAKVKGRHVADLGKLPAGFGASAKKAKRSK